ncbi:unnamed protein product [Amoebophrya sp. A120]|nr:unnamed protein product [Amoebophrya sp. A120]|eukprot:GSA120T00011033001.1
MFKHFVTFGKLRSALHFVALVRSICLPRNFYVERTKMEKQVENTDFYANYHGHTVNDLKQLVRNLRSAGRRRFIYLMGDSTLDNKHWLYPPSRLGKSRRALEDPRCGAAACNGYEQALSAPKRSVMDVAYWVNRAVLADVKNSSGAVNKTSGGPGVNKTSGGGEEQSAAEVQSEDPSARESTTTSSPPYVCVNAAIEESTLGGRSGNTLLPQDRFVSHALTEEDVIVVSAGGNDIALAPGFLTVVNILSALLYSTTVGQKENGYAPGLAHFVNLFGKQTEGFLLNVLQGKRPKVVVVCMLYFLNTDSNQASWANGTLGILKYNSQPEILQGFIRYVFHHGTKNVKIPGVTVVPLPLFDTLDGSDTRDYVARVEPSVVGGKKLGFAIWNAVKTGLNLQEPARTSTMEEFLSAGEDVDEGVPEG